MRVDKSKFRVVAWLIPIFLLSGCPWSDSDNDNTIVEQEDSGIYFDISSVDYAAVSVDEGTLEVGARVLAAQCAQCHGTFGVAVADWPDLWGTGRQTGSWMHEYQDADLYSDNVMHLHALAYTSDEVNLLKSYYDVVDYAVQGGE